VILQLTHTTILLCSNYEVIYGDTENDELETDGSRNRAVYKTLQLWSVKSLPV